MSLGPTPDADRLNTPCACRHPSPAVPHAPAQGGGLAAKDDTLRLLSWNVQKGRGGNWLPDLAAIGHDCDVIALQEVRLTPGLRDLLRQFGFSGQLAPAFAYFGQPTGVLTAADSRPLDTCQLRSIEPLIRSPKSTLMVRYPLAGRAHSLLMINLHALNFVPGSGVYRRWLDRIAAIAGRHRGPMIVSGDFNTWSRGRQAALGAVVARLGLVAVDFADRPRTRILGRPVDHVFYRGMAVAAAAVVAVETSDHNPLMVTFTLGP
jgi:endonuclease/exonuclease/phosphatase (EEP) superfamily protein YafD